MRLIFIPRPAPTGARNQGYRRWFRQEPAAYPGGLGPPGSVPNPFGTRKAPQSVFRLGVFDTGEGNGTFYSGQGKRFLPYFKENFSGGKEKCEPFLNN